MNTLTIFLIGPCSQTFISEASSYLAVNPDYSDARVGLLCLYYGSVLTALGRHGDAIEHGRRCRTHIQQHFNAKRRPLLLGNFFYGNFLWIMELAAVRPTDSLYEEALDLALTTVALSDTIPSLNCMVSTTSLPCPLSNLVRC